MLWAEDIPILKTEDNNGNSIEVIIVAGSIGELSAQGPVPKEDQ